MDLFGFFRQGRAVNSAITVVNDGSEGKKSPSFVDIEDAKRFAFNAAIYFPGRWSVHENGKEVAFYNSHVVSD